MCEVIAERLEAEMPDLLAGETEVDESYIGGARKGKRGQGTGGCYPERQRRGLIATAGDSDLRLG